MISHRDSQEPKLMTDTLVYCAFRELTIYTMDKGISVGLGISKALGDNGPQRVKTFVKDNGMDFGMEFLCFNMVLDESQHQLFSP
jgi:hypothetical protein